MRSFEVLNGLFGVFLAVLRSFFNFIFRWLAMLLVTCVLEINQFLPIENEVQLNLRSQNDWGLDLCFNIKMIFILISL